MNDKGDWGDLRLSHLFGWRIKADLIVSQGSKSKGVRRGEISINWGDFLESIMAKESVLLDLPFG